jgi:hypothetical protein
MSRRMKMDLKDTYRKTYKMTNTVRKTLFDTRKFLISLNKRSDQIAKEKDLPRCYEAQMHYQEATGIIARIDEILK